MECEHLLVPMQQKKSVTFSGLVGATLFLLIALPLMFFNLLAGLAVTAVAMLIGFMGRSETVMVCQKCAQVVKPHSPPSDAWG